MNYRDRLSEKGLAIFLLHGVVERSEYGVRNYTRKHIEKDYFYHFILELKQSGHPLSMDDVVQHHSESKPFPPRAFAITFDDGFANNYSIAAPILNDLNTPATFYLTTDFIDRNIMAWIDRIEYCLESVPGVRLTLPRDSTEYNLQNVQDKVRFLDYLRSRVKHDKNIDVDELVSHIFAQCGIEELLHSDDPLDLKMTWEQVKELQKNTLFTIGGHSHRHVILSFLTNNELEEEIPLSIRLLNDKAGIKPRHYSYPEGLEYCFSPEVIRVLQEQGITCSPTAIDGINNLETGLFYLKRIMVT